MIWADKKQGEKQTNEEQKNEIASSSVRNNEKQLLSSVSQESDVSNKYENAVPEREGISTSSVNATGGSILSKAQIFGHSFNV